MPSPAATVLLFREAREIGRSVGCDLGQVVFEVWRKRHSLRQTLEETTMPKAIGLIRVGAAEALEQILTVRWPLAPLACS